ncbi:hypothetical protein FACS18948_1240 [Clostridia bacterium]|nr:hypothetical protein FACS18948_1240 [Clostridia bacterium]
MILKKREMNAVTRAALIPDSVLKRVLIVDDDKILRRYMLGNVRSLVPAGYEILEAYDGLNALEVMRNSPVGILLTDMRMPHMDGLSLIQQAKAQYPYLQIIVLSNYDDFDYVKPSFLYGIVDYVLKMQLAQDELRILLEKACAALTTYNTRAEHEERLRISALVVEARSFGADWSAALNSGIQPHCIMSRLPAYTDSLYAVRLDILPEDSRQVTVEDAIRVLVGELDNSNNQNDSNKHVATMQSLIVTLPGVRQTLRLLALLAPNANNSHANDKLVRERAENIIDAFDELNAISCCVVKRMDGWQLSIAREMEDRMRQLFYMDASGFAAPLGNLFCLSVCEDAPSQFAAALNQGDIQAALRILHDTNAWLREYMPPPDDAIALMNHFRKAIEGVAGRDITQNTALNALQNIRRLTPIVRTIEYELSRIMPAAEPSKDLTRISTDKERIDALMAQISQRLDLPIDLKTAAARVGYSIPHFCRIFRNETGESFNVYLTRTRMNMARKLLSIPGARVKMVAQAVGIADTAYFRKLYAKHTGQSADAALSRAAQS